jgi:hypothetical protein
MNAMFRRLQRIEARLAPKPHAVAPRAVELLCDRRRCRAEANGQPYVEVPQNAVTPGRRLSTAETLPPSPATGMRAVRRDRAEIATDIPR